MLRKCGTPDEMNREPLLSWDRYSSSTVRKVCSYQRERKDSFLEFPTEGKPGSQRGRGRGCRPPRSVPIGKAASVLVLFSLASLGDLFSKFKFQNNVSNSGQFFNSALLTMKRIFLPASSNSDTVLKKLLSIIYYTWEIGMICKVGSHEIPQKITTDPYVLVEGRGSIQKGEF